jgi:hypothetical protein
MQQPPNEMIVHDFDRGFTMFVAFGIAYNCRKCICCSIYLDEHFKDRALLITALNFVSISLCCVLIACLYYVLSAEA